jgi:hypothetical protein
VRYSENAIFLLLLLNKPVVNLSPETIVEVVSQEVVMIEVVKKVAIEETEIAEEDLAEMQMEETNGNVSIYLKKVYLCRALE